MTTTTDTRDWVAERAQGQNMALLLEQLRAILQRDADSASKHLKGTYEFLYYGDTDRMAVVQRAAYESQERFVIFAPDQYGDTPLQVEMRLVPGSTKEVGFGVRPVWNEDAQTTDLVVVEDGRRLGPHSLMQVVQRALAPLFFPEADEVTWQSPQPPIAPPDGTPDA